MLAFLLDCRDGHLVDPPRESRYGGVRLVAHERILRGRSGAGVCGDRFRTALTRACTAAGVPAFSPHDLRHRRNSLLHLAGVPRARIGEHVGRRNLAVTADTYGHVLANEAELDYAELLECA